MKSRPGELRLSERLALAGRLRLRPAARLRLRRRLKETGLPQTDVPLALLTFNLGVEAGQLMFVALVLLVFRAFRAIVSGPLPALRLLAAYGIGTASMFWLISRVASFGAA